MLERLTGSLYLKLDANIAVSFFLFISLVGQAVPTLFFFSV